MKRRVLIIFIIYFTISIFLIGGETKKTYWGAGASYLYNTDLLELPFSSDGLSYYHINIGLELDKAISEKASAAFNLSIPFPGGIFYNAGRWYDVREKLYMITGGVKLKLGQNYFITSKFGVYFCSEKFYGTGKYYMDDNKIGVLLELSGGINLIKTRTNNVFIEGFVIITPWWANSYAASKFTGIRFGLYYLI